jgi:hypothetical protein
MNGLLSSQIPSSMTLLDGFDNCQQQSVSQILNQPIQLSKVVRADLEPGRVPPFSLPD